MSRKEVFRPSAEFSPNQPDEYSFCRWMCGVLLQDSSCPFSENRKAEPQPFAASSPTQCAGPSLVAESQPIARTRVTCRLLKRAIRAAARSMLHPPRTMVLSVASNPPSAIPITAKYFSNPLPSQYSGSHASKSIWRRACHPTEIIWRRRIGHRACPSWRRCSRGSRRTGSAWYRRRSGREPRPSR